jgi:molybdopterin-guanine dinucleotide biosynthesis protein A
MVMTAPDRIPLAAILAGGRATRMGRDKAGIRLGGVPLIERVFDRVRGVAQAVIVVGGLPRLDHRGVPTLPDRYPGANAMGGIATALAHAARTGGDDLWVLCVGCDTPFVETGLLRHLWGQRADADIVVPRTSHGWEPLCALYRTTCLGAFEQAIGDGNLRVFDVYPRVRCQEVPEGELRRVDPDLRSFFNVNRPEDLAAAQQLLVPPA